MEIVTSFPEGFLWGAATSAYQCEGAAEGYGKKDNQQDVINREIHDEYGYADASVASDHYHHYKEDVALMAEMGFSSYRFSINWARVLPDGVGAPNPEGVEFYHNLLHELHAHNIEPVVTMWHYDLPMALVNKYGLVPKSAYPESENSRNSDDFKQYLNSKLREFAAELRRRSAAGASEDELRALKDEYMGTVYRICAVALGEPPEKFDFLARVSDDDKKDDKKSGEDEADKPKTGKDERRQIRETGITPMEFYKKYVPVDVDDLVTLCNVPMASRPFNKRYRIRYTANVAEAGDMEFVNVPLDVFKKAAVDQISAGHPIWFACDCTQFALRKDGFFDQSVVRVDQLFGTEFTGDKAHGLEYGDSPSNHAMTLTGVNLDEQGKPNRWKVENSWGKDNGEDGYYVASDKWFDRYVTEIIIRKEYLDDATRALLETEPVELDPWQPLTKRCR